MIENNQNAGWGRSPPRNTPNIAVVRGNIPKNTIECAEVTYCRAKAESNGNPITTPIATRLKEKRWVFVGRFSLKASKKQRASSPAIVARATVTNNGLRSNTAKRVAGMDPLKISTPINPLIQPLLFLMVGLLKNEMLCAM